MIDNELIYDYKQGNFEKINEYLTTIDWDKIRNQSNNVDQFLTELYLHLNTSMDQFIPKMKTNQRNYPKFFSYELISCISKKIQ